jgi:hypothetical protein
MYKTFDTSHRTVTYYIGDTLYRSRVGYNIRPTYYIVIDGCNIRKTTKV